MTPDALQSGPQAGPDSPAQAAQAGPFAVTLLCNPAAPRLDPALVSALKNAWGGAELRVLAPDTAAEFFIDRMPDNRWQVWEDCQKLGVDLVVQPAAGRR